MSVVGVDFGTSKTVVAIVGRGGIDTVTNNISGRKTASQVGFDNLARCLGEVAKTNWKRNFRKTVRFPKRLLGRDYAHSDLEWEHAGAAKYIPGENGDTNVNLFFKGEEYNFNMEQIVAMLFTHVKEITEDFTKLPASDIVITVPGYWCDKRRRALLNAAQIAGLNVIRVVNDLTASAINYLYLNRKKLEAEEARKVLIVDSGAANTSVGIFEFKKSGLKTLGCAYDENLGGRDIDAAIANLFASRFTQKTGANIKDYPKSWLRLLEACEGVKKTLNLGGASAGVNEVCIFDDFDLNETITREEYLELLEPLTNRLQGLVQQALEYAETTPEELFCAEWVGGCMRVDLFQAAVTEVVGKPAENHMNAEEAMSHGAALQCAYLSPRIQLQNQFTIQEIQDFGIQVSWQALDGSDQEQSLDLVKTRGRASYKAKQLTLKRPAVPMVLTLSYNDPSMLIGGQDPIIGRYIVPEVPKVAETDMQDVVVKFNYDHNFTTTLSKLSIMHKVEVEYQEEVKEDTPAEKPEEEKPEVDAPVESSAAETDVEMTDVESAPEPAPEPIQKKFVTKTRTEKKMNPIAYTLDTPFLSEDALKAFQDEEKKLKDIDTYQAEVDYTKNSLESYVYTTRSALGDKLKEFVTEAEFNTFMADLNGTESWLYDEGMRETLEVYKAKLAGLRAQGDRYTKRMSEWNSRDEAIAHYRQISQTYRNEATSGKEEYAHIENLTDIITEIDKVDALMEEKIQQATSVSKTDDPIVFAADIRERGDNLHLFCQKILNTPKPKVVEEKAKEETATEEAQAETSTETETAEPTDDAMNVDDLD